MPAPLETKDPTIAVLIERMTRLGEDFASYRAEMKEENAELRKEITSLKNEVSSQSKFFTQAQGGFWLLITVGGLLAWALGVFEKIWKFFH
jgi:hypothetical protein